eukprot:s1129_g2.t1
MPWRSRVGEPYGRNVTDHADSDVISEASGLQDWDTGFVDEQELFCSPDAAVDAQEGSVGNALETEFGPDQGIQLDVVSTGSDVRPERKRAAENPVWHQGAGIDDRLFSSMVKLPRSGVPRQPWETGSFSCMFNKSTPVLKMPWLALPNLGRQESFQGLTVSPSVEPPERSTARTPFYHKRLLATRLAQTDDQLRAQALRRLRDLILVVPVHTQLGRALLDTSGQLTGEDRISAVFADAFRSRATATLVKRSGDYYKMAVWLQTNLNLMPMQLSEGVIYQYLSFLRESEAAPTSADATVKSIWFMHATAGIVDFNPGAFTSRITGVCRDMFLRKRTLKQAPCFPASVVKALETYALTCGNKADSMFTNFLLFCVFASCRIGDASKIKEVEFSRHHDVFLVEAATSEAKNTNTKERRTMLLPFTAVGWGVHPNPWCLKWKLQLDSVKHETIMPAFSEVSGEFLNRRITTSEANLWLKEVLVRAGLSAVEANRQFDGAPFQDLQNAAIRNDEFNPDASNAARIFRDNMDICKATDQAKDWSEDWAASESDVSGDESFYEGCHFMGDHHTPADQVDGSKLLRKESLVVHMKRDQATLWCGRKLTANYRAWEQGDPDLAQLLVCQQCDKSQPR